jgi:hypothetical protein
MYGDPLTPLERDVIATILRDPHPAMDGLRDQLAVCRIKSRQFTGAGFYTDIVVPQALAVAGLDRLTLTNVHAEIDGLEHGAGFALWIQDGMLDTLEGFTYVGPWPAQSDVYVVSVPPTGFQAGTTDLERLAAARGGSAL